MWELVESVFTAEKIADEEEIKAALRVSLTSGAAKKSSEANTLAKNSEDIAIAAAAIAANPNCYPEMARGIGVDTIFEDSEEVAIEVRARLSPRPLPA